MKKIKGKKRNPSRRKKTEPIRIQVNHKAYQSPSQHSRTQNSPLHTLNSILPSTQHSNTISLFPILSFSLNLFAGQAVKNSLFQVQFWHGYVQKLKVFRPFLQSIRSLLQTSINKTPSELWEPDEELCLP